LTKEISALNFMMRLIKRLSFYQVMNIAHEGSTFLEDIIVEDLIEYMVYSVDHRNIVTRINQS